MDAGTVPEPGLRLSARITGDIAIARLRGELDIASSPDLRDQLLGLLQRGSSHLVIDLSAVTYADASGLAVLVGAGRRARRLGGSLYLAAVSAQVDHVLGVTGLHRHLEVFATVQAAVASLPGGRGGSPDAAETDPAAPVTGVAAPAARPASPLPPSYSSAVSAAATRLRRVLSPGSRPVPSVR